MSTTPTTEEETWIRRNWWLVAVGVVVAVVGIVLITQLTASTADTEVASLQGQGTCEDLAVGASDECSGDIYETDGATLSRSDDAVAVTLNVPKPEPGSYTYPAPMTPRGEEHPPVAPGEQEVFSLWLFVFNYPELCRDPYVCRLFDVFGDEETPNPPAQGGVFQLDSMVATGDVLDMAGVVTLDSAPYIGAPLLNPLCSHVHVGLDPHGQALEGEDLEFQLAHAVGGPDVIWLAQFETLDRGKGCETP